MLRLSTKGRYGMRAMLELAHAYGDGAPLKLSEICQRQEISRKYLDALLGSLRKAGLVRSVRGVHGGFILAKPPGEIPTRAILEVLEGPFAIVECVTDPEYCKRQADCVTRGLWTDLTEAVVSALDGVTLATLASRVPDGHPQALAQFGADKAIPPQLHT